MTIQLIKKEVGRRRFLRTGPLDHAEEWLTELSALKDFLARETNFQIVGPKVHFETDGNLPFHPKMMLEVVGTPRAFEQKGLEMIDFEKTSLLIYQFTNKDLFQLDQNELLATGSRIMATLKKRHDLNDIFHIVYDHAKIELHFFLQKDYIQKQF